MDEMWFAWKPIRTDTGWKWLRYVWRRKSDGKHVVVFNSDRKYYYWDLHRK